MIVAHNIAAMNAQRQFNIVNNQKAKSMEKLSSGYKVNRAADDAASLSISEKMRRQIRGLRQGTDNTRDGISLCQVADGAFSEVHEMLHRINELSVQAANDVNSLEDRQAIQEEVDNLVEEINRISSVTEFNGKKLFQGTKEIINVTGENYVASDVSGITLGVSYFQNQFENSYNEITDGTFTVDITIGNYVAYNERVTIGDTNYLVGVTFQDEMQRIDREGNRSFQFNFSVDTPIGKTSSFSKTDGVYYANILFNSTPIDLSSVDAYHDENGVLRRPSINTVSSRIDGGGSVWIQCMIDQNHDGVDDENSTLVNRDKCIELLKKHLSEANSKDGVSDASVTATKTHSGLDSDTWRFTVSKPKEKAGEREIIKDTSLWIQSGSDAGQGMFLEIPAWTKDTLGLEKANVLSHTKAAKTIDIVGKAINTVSAMRSKIGAQQNRLEYTVANNENVIENTTKSESLIRDTDMAEEIVRNAKLEILSQAGMSILAQANQSNKDVLNMLNSLS